MNEKNTHRFFIEIDAKNLAIAEGLMDRVLEFIDEIGHRESVTDFGVLDIIE